MPEQEPIVIDVMRLPDPIEEFGPDSRSGLSNPVCATMSDATCLDLYFHQDGEPGIANGELVGLTEAQALALVKERGLHL